MTAATYSEAARNTAERNHPARLLGVAQVAIETALRTNDLTEVHAQLAEALTRIKPAEVTRIGARCNHAPTGAVTSQPGNGRHSHAPVCDLPECIAEALAWATNWTGIAATYTHDSERSAS